MIEESRKPLASFRYLDFPVDLLGLLKWVDDPSRLDHSLKALLKLDGEEIVKFLQDVLDALFLILISEDTRESHKLVFECLVRQSFFFVKFFLPNDSAVQTPFRNKSLTATELKNNEVNFLFHLNKYNLT